MSNQWDDQTHAMKLLERLLRGTGAPIDPGGGSQQLRDFDLVLPDGRTIAVEVTRHNLPLALATMAEVRKRVWQFPGLSNRWFVKMTVAANVKRMHTELASLLVQLEFAGVDALRPNTHRLFGDVAGLTPAQREQHQTMDQTGTLEIGRRLYKLGVRHAYTVEPPGKSPGEVVLTVANDGGSTGASVMVATAGQLANLKDNANKLAAASTHDERHLFVWAEHTRFELVAALRTAGRGIGVPQVPPQIPDFVDAVWLATASEPSTVWCYRRDTGWAYHGEVAVDEAERVDTVRSRLAADPSGSSDSPSRWKGSTACGPGRSEIALNRVPIA